MKAVFFLAAFLTSLSSFAGGVETGQTSFKSAPEMKIPFVGNSGNDSKGDEHPPYVDSIVMGNKDFPQSSVSIPEACRAFLADDGGVETIRTKWF